MAMVMPVAIVLCNVLPMGLKKAPQMSKRMMEDLLFSENAELQKLCNTYIYNIIVATPVDDFHECFEEHKCQVRGVLQLLRKKKLVSGLNKEKWLLKIVHFHESVLKIGLKTLAPRKMADLQL